MEHSSLWSAQSNTTPWFCHPWWLIYLLINPMHVASEQSRMIRLPHGTSPPSLSFTPVKCLCPSQRDSLLICQQNLHLLSLVSAKYYSTDHSLLPHVAPQQVLYCLVHYSRNTFWVLFCIWILHDACLVLFLCRCDCFLLRLSVWYYISVSCDAFLQHDLLLHITANAVTAALYCTVLLN